MPLIPVFEIGIANAWIFMSVFLLQMLVMVFVDKGVREKTHVPVEVRKNKFEKYVAIIGNLIWLLSMGYSVFLPLRLHTDWFYAGLSVFIIGLIIMTIATVNFITTPADLLITKGVYRLSRHPMYLAFFIICLGTGIATLSWLFLFFSLIMVFCFHQEALIEERYCLDKYGHDYREYLNSVPRWFGKPNRSGS